jgi:hypothetical protein
MAGALDTGGLDVDGIKTGGLQTGGLGRADIEQLVNEAISTRMAGMRFQGDKEMSTFGRGGNWAIRNNRPIRHDLPPLQGDTGNPLLWTPIYHQVSGSWKWKIKTGLFYSDFDLSTSVTLSQLNTDIAMNASGDYLFLEIAFGTFPTVNSATIKAAGGTTLPGGGVLEYDQDSSGSTTINTQTKIRVPLAKAETIAGLVTVTQMRYNAIFLLATAANMNDSSNSNQTVVGGFVFL